MKFDIFRAYAAATATRKGVEVDPKTLKAHRVKKEHAVEDVVAEGKADKGGETATFSSDQKISRVVFYKLDRFDDEGEPVETVVGSVDVNADGDISVACPEPEAAPDPTEIV